MVIFLLSLALLVSTSIAIAKKVGDLSAERFWAFYAVATLQLGTLSMVTSVFSLLNPAGWIVAQLLLSISVFYFGGAPPRLGVLWTAARTWPANVKTCISRYVHSLAPASLAALICVVLLLCFSGIAQLFTPIYIGDEKMYHASRVIYWIQNNSIFPYTTHNDRQTVFTFGSELLFLWPVLLTRSETLGRVIFWLGYPFAALGQYYLLRILRINRGPALAGVLVLISTPIIGTYSVGLKPEMWFITAVLGTAYWAVASCGDAERVVRNCFLLGLFTMLGVNVRPLALAMVPVVVALPFFLPAGAERLLQFKAMLRGLVTGLLLSAVLVPFAFNLAYYHHFLGPKGLRDVVSSELSASQLYTHAVRFPFLLLEVPDASDFASVRAGISALGNRAIAAAGASRPLRLEDRPWPGRYTYVLPEFATRFSVWGIFWLPAVAAGVWLLIRNLFTTWPNVKLGPIPVLTALAAPLLFGILLGVRWMVHSGVPERFLIAPFALAVPLGLVVVNASLQGRKFCEAVLILTVACAVYAPLRQSAARAVAAVVNPVTPSQADAPFQAALAVMPDCSHILFVGNQDAPDYPLFLPRRRYANRVTSWGKAPFDAARMQSILKSAAITHVLIQNDQSAFFQWAPEIPTGPFVSWLTAQPGSREVQLPAPHMRLFAFGQNAVLRPNAVRTAALPESAPLIIVDNLLNKQVGLDPTFLRTPWNIEDLGTKEQGFLWIGSGLDEGLKFMLWADEARSARFVLHLTPGPSRTDATRTLSILRNQAPIADHVTFTGDTSLALPVELAPGSNWFHVYSTDNATVTAMPNGDTRHLIIGLHEIRITPGAERKGQP